MGQPRFNPWIFAGDLVVANMQAGAVLWHRFASPQGGAATARMINETIAAATAAEPGTAAATPAPKTVKANAKRLRKRSPRKG
jgi:hypothetical protein